MTDYTKPVPDTRTIVPGTWSDVENARSEAFNKDANNVTALNMVDVNAIDIAVLKGTLHAVNNEFTLAPGESVGFKIRAAGGTFVRFANADGLTVKYVTSFTGKLLLLGSSRSLNSAIDNGYRAFYDKFGSLVFADEEVILSGNAPLSTGIFSDQDVFIVVKNNTSQTVSDSFSAGMQSVGAFTTPYGIIGSTLLISTTEMSTYD